MIITDYNKMSLLELYVIYFALGKEFLVENGRIVTKKEGDAGE